MPSTPLKKPTTTSKHKTTKKSKSRKSKSMRTHSYGRYIHKVLKTVHHGNQLGLTKKTVDVLDGILHHLFEQIVEQAVQIKRLGKCKTLRAKDIQSAVKLILPKEIGDHAVKEARRSLRPRQAVAGGLAKKSKFQSNCC